MTERDPAVAIESLRGAIALVEGRIEALVQSLETYIKTHEHEHAKLAEMVAAAKAAVDRDLHTLNNLDAQMDGERNLLASKQSVTDLEKATEKGIAVAREHAAKGDEAIDRRVTEFKSDIEKRMAEIERQAGVSTGSGVGNAKANAAWIGGILFIIAVVGFLLKLAGVFK